MVRSIFANKSLHKYLSTLAETKEFTYGVIIGQVSESSKDYAVHIAKTEKEGQENGTSDNNTIVKTESTNLQNTKSKETLDNFDGQNLINHAINVTKMIPGSFYVLGFFVITEENAFSNVKAIANFKNLFQVLDQTFKINKYFYGRPTNQEKDIGYLLLNYTWSSYTFECKSFDCSGSNPMPADWKFIDQSPEWHMFETNYDLDDIFPINDRKNCINLENNFMNCLERINKNIFEYSQMFMENEIFDENQIFENYLKEKIKRKETTNSFKAYLLQLESLPPNFKPKILEFHGTIHYIGTIYSRIWVHSKCSFKDIEKFTKFDIIRSLAARIQIFCDGITNMTSLQPAIMVNIPPKRIFFNIADDSGIQFSEYLFNGEDALTAIQQAKDILDININVTDVVTDLEILPDYNDAVSIDSQANKSEKIMINEKCNDSFINYYMSGAIIAAIIALLVAALLYYIMR